MVRFSQFIFFIIFRLPFKFFLRPSFAGLENIEKLEDGGHLLVCNHSARIDPFTLSVLPWKVLLKIFPYYFPVSEHEYQKFKYRIFIRPLGAYPLKISGGWTVDDYFGNSKKLLKNGKNIVLFPEGGFRSEYHRKAKPGFVFLPSELGIQLLPLHIEGLFNFTLKDFFLRRRRLKLTFGEPFGVPKTDISKYRDVANSIIERIYSL